MESAERRSVSPETVGTVPSASVSPGSTSDSALLRLDGRRQINLIRIPGDLGPAIERPYAFSPLRAHGPILRADDVEP